LEEFVYIQQARLDRLGLLACGIYFAWLYLAPSNGLKGGVPMEEIPPA
jgi:hypothetical protein